MMKKYLLFFEIFINYITNHQNVSIFESMFQPECDTVFDKTGEVKRAATAATTVRRKTQKPVLERGPQCGLHD
jgi:hypothetical protein